jgi:hypothetical protein
MKKLIIIAFIIFIIYDWDQVSKFVSANAAEINNSITHWLVDHTPKK